MLSECFFVTVGIVTDDIAKEICVETVHIIEVHHC